MQSRCMSGSTSSQASADKGKQSKSDKARDQIKDLPTSYCQGCNRDNHRREDCRIRTHPDFKKRGQWDGCLDAAAPAAPPRKDDTNDRDQRRRRDNDSRDRDSDRRDQGGRGGRGVDKSFKFGA